MKVVFLVRMDNDYLFIKNSITGKYELPSIECNESLEGVKKLELELNNMEIGISIFENMDLNLSIKNVIEVYEARVYSYKTSNKGLWINFQEEVSEEFEDWCLAISTFLSDKRSAELKIEFIIKNAIEKAIDGTGLNIEFVARDKELRVFLKGEKGDYSPYIFVLKYEEENEETVSVRVLWQTIRMYASGEKTDLYVLFADSMNIILKVFLNELAEVLYIGHVCVEDEIGGSVIILNNKFRSVHFQDLGFKISEIFDRFLMAMQMHYLIFGSYSIYLKNKTNVEREWLLKGVKVDNIISREDHVYYTNYDQGISMLELSEEQFSSKILYEAHEWEIIDGIDGKIIVQKERYGKSYNLIPDQRWEYLQKILIKNKCEQYTVICQENKLYLLESNRIWILEGGFYHYWVEEEKEKIFERQKKENVVLYFDKKFKWKYPIVPSRFEELVADLLETETKVSKVRLMGKSNNSDGGRDILVYKMGLGADSQNDKEYLLIGQCKAYKNSVNKSQVTDIRDMLENYNAKGFILAVTSELTVPLIDNLSKLAERYEVEWWTGREIFAKLRRNFYLLERYKDIVEVEEN